MNENTETKQTGKPPEKPAVLASGGEVTRRTLASTPLVVTLAIILFAAVCIQGAFLTKIYLEQKDQTESSQVEENKMPTPLIAKNTGSGTAAPLAPAPSQVVDPFFSDDWQPFAEMARMREEMDRLFDDSFTRFRTLPGFDESWLDLGKNFSGDASIEEKEGNYIVTMQVPGAEEASLDIKLEDDVLSVSGKREEIDERRDEEGTVIRRSQSVSNFQRSFSLPNADSSGLKSNYQDGVLTITVSKGSPEKS